MTVILVAIGVAAVIGLVNLAVAFSVVNLE